uniref:RH22643p n=1 Tax=Drosophila melanogaster TaxID=7227 RepID=A8E778_DROME|nr:RH22643p [Drosophila melanogaster]
MMLSFNYATAESKSLFVFREIFISMFCSMFCSKMSRNIFQFVLWLNKGESLSFTSSPPCNVVNIREWSEERSRQSV